LFIGENAREAVGAGRADYIPIFLSEVPPLIRSGTLKIDVALVQVSPPDRHGFCSLGVSVEASRAAVLAADRVIGQVNRHMPRTQGDGLIHASHFDALVWHDEPMIESKRREPSDVDRRIGALCAELVEDGATLQVGIGGIPNAVLEALADHRHLGVHSEMFSDGIIPLVEKGVVDNSRKAIHPGKLVASFVMGSRALYDFVDDNPAVALLDLEYTNNPNVISRNPKVTAINSAIEIDLTGQVCADSIGPRMYSGVGGQVDYIRGAARSEGGKPIIALPSMTRRGESRIVSQLKPGAGVATTRADVHYVVTEHGSVNLHGKDLRQRAKALIALADPSCRESLEKEAFERFGPL
jgi:acyl-CoA hydrolase